MTLRELRVFAGLRFFAALRMTRGAKATPHCFLAFETSKLHLKVAPG